MNEEYKRLFAELYQICGALNCNSKILDNLAAGSGGLKLPHITLLPQTDYIPLRQPEIMLSLYENYVKVAEDLIKYLRKTRKQIPDKYYVPYTSEHTSLCWELAKRNKG